MADQTSSWLASTSGSAYDLRAEAVHWDKAPACGARLGRDNVTCIREPGHDGRHAGNGFDEFGPLNPCEWSERDNG